MNRKTLLMLAYHFPPENAIGAARPHRFYKYIHQFGWNPLVVTAAPQDPGHAPADVHWIEDDFFGPTRDWKWQVERVVRRLATPADMALSWSIKAAQFCKERIAAASPDETIVLYSSFPPLGVHLAGLQVLRKKRVGWIADYRDPLATEPTRITQLNAFSRLVTYQLERRMIEQPSIIVANTEAAAAEWRQQYPQAAHKIRVIWNGFDPSDDLTAPPLPEGQRKVFLHAGSMYGGRHTGPIMASMDRLLRNGRVAPNSVVFRFVGPRFEGSFIPTDVVARGVQQGWVELIDSVSRATAHTMSSESAGMMLIQPQSDTQVPGKLFEYVRLGRPILAFIRKRSPIDEVLAQCGIPNVCLYPEDTADQVDEAMLRFFAMAPGPWKPSPWFENTFNAVDQARTLCSFADEALDAQRA